MSKIEIGDLVRPKIRMQVLSYSPDWMTVLENEVIFQSDIFVVEKMFFLSKRYGLISMKDSKRVKVYTNKVEKIENVK